MWCYFALFFFLFISNSTIAFVPSGWGLQAQEHSLLARELLPFCSSISPCRGEKLEVLTCLLSIHLTQGGAALLTAKYPCHDMFDSKGVGLN